VLNSASIPVFDWLFKKRRPRQNEDPLFGKLIFVEAKNPSDSFWEGRGRFNPIDSDVAYSAKVLFYAERCSNHEEPETGTLLFSFRSNLSLPESV